MARVFKPTRKAAVGMQLMNHTEVDGLLQELASDVQFKALDAAAKAGGKPVLRALRETSPDSRRTGSRKKQSASVKNKWRNSKRLKTTMRSVVRKTKFGVTVFAGPAWSHGGGHGNLFSRDHKRKVLWGSNSGELRQVNRFVKNAADTTRGQAQSAITQKLRSEIDKYAKQGKVRG